MRASDFLRCKNSAIVSFIAAIAINGFGQSTVTFNVDGAAVIVNKEVFGLLMERLGKQWSGGVWVGTNSSIKNTAGMRQDVIDGFVECGVGALEWPGGCAANGYNWESNKNPSNDVGVDRFIQLCKLTGTEAIIAGQGTSTSASSNLAFCLYVTNTLGYPLKWFKIGNEVWGCGGNQSVNTYITNYTANYNKLKDVKSADNGKNLSIIAAAGASEGSFGWITTYMNSIGGTIDAVEYHDYIYYPNSISSTNPTTANYWQVMKDVLSGDIHTHLYSSVFPLMNSTDPDKRVKLVLDEWGDWLIDTGDEWMQTVTLMDGLSTGAHLNMFVQNADRVKVACLAQGVNVIHSIININSSGVMVKTPAFYVFKLYKPHHADGARFVPITASKFETVSGGGSSLPAVTAAATVDSLGFVNISFTNVDLSSERRVAVSLTSAKPSYAVMSADVVTGPAHTSTNGFGATEQVSIKPLAAASCGMSGKTLTATLPAMSIVMVRLASPDALSVHQGRTNLLDGRMEAFSIEVRANGRLHIVSPMRLKTPMTIGLYSVDGRILAENISTPSMGESATLDLGNTAGGAGVYLVKIAGPDIHCSRRFIIAR